MFLRLFSKRLSGLVFLFLVLGSALFAENATLQSLDTILTRAKGLEDFLSDQNEKARDEYYHELRRYYGEENIDKFQFNAIIQQLKLMNARIEGFGDRLWETNEKGALGKPYFIEGQVRTRGYQLARSKWNQYFDKWSANLNEAGGAESSTRQDQVEDVFQDWNKKIENHENEIGGLSRRQQDEKNREFFKELRADPNFKSALSYFLARSFENDHIRDRLVSGDADTLLDALSEMRQNTRGVEWPKGIRIPNRILPMIRDLIPSEEELLKMPMFERETRTTHSGKEVAQGRGAVDRYDFVPLPRRIHGIWKGIPLGECVGSGCSKSLTPERWATTALEGAQIFHAEKNGEYKGFVQLIPVKVDGKTYASIDFGASDLARSTATKDPVTGEKHRSLMFDLWIKEAEKHLPKSWKGFVVGESQHIDNAGVISVVHQSPAYLLGKEVGNSKKIEINDPMAILIPANRPNDTVSPYGNKMIYDASVPESGWLVMLDSKAAGKETELKDWIKILESSKSARKIEKALRAISTIASSINTKSAQGKKLMSILESLASPRNPQLYLESVKILDAMNMLSAKATTELFDLWHDHDRNFMESTPDKEKAAEYAQALLKKRAADPGFQLVLAQILIDHPESGGVQTRLAEALEHAPLSKGAQELLVAYLNQDGMGLHNAHVVPLLMKHATTKNLDLLVAMAKLPKAYRQEFDYEYEELMKQIRDEAYHSKDPRIRSLYQEDFSRHDIERSEIVAFCREVVETLSPRKPKK